MTVKSAAFEIIRNFKGPRGAQEIARITCGRCPAHEEKPISGQLNPGHMARTFIEMGWECDGRNPRRNRCPNCARKQPHDPDALIKEAEKKMQQAPIQKPAPTALGQALTAAGQEIAMRLKPDQKLKVRALLDNHFDDSRGMYEDGYSDQRIGQESDVPWQAVASLREIAYGPIKTDAEIEQLRTALGAVDGRIEQIEKSVANDIGHLKQLAGQLRDRLAGAEKRLGIHA